jgi:hypothetical protein
VSVFTAAAAAAAGDLEASSACHVVCIAQHGSTVCLLLSMATITMLCRIPKHMHVRIAHTVWVL